MNQGLEYGFGRKAGVFLPTAVPVISVRLSTRLSNASLVFRSSHGPCVEAPPADLVPVCAVKGFLDLIAEFCIELPWSTPSTLRGDPTNSFRGNDI